MPKGKSAERRKRVIVTVDFAEGQMRRRKSHEIYTVRKNSAYSAQTECGLQGN
jgi:hypothetical protein